MVGITCGPRAITAPRPRRTQRPDDTLVIAAEEAWAFFREYRLR